jgi:hypothetical protein
MKYLKFFSTVALIIFSLKSEAQKKFSLSSLKLGYSPITNNKLFRNGETANSSAIFDIYSQNMLVAGLLSDISLSDNRTLRLGLSYSVYNADFKVDMSDLNTNIKGIWLDAYFDKKIRSKVFHNFYYGVSVGYLQTKGSSFYDYLVLYRFPYNYDSYNRLSLNLTAGTEIRIFRNTNAFVELGYYQKGLLTVGVSQDFFNRETGKSVY